MHGLDLVVACLVRALSQIAVHLADVADLVAELSVGVADLARLAVVVLQSVLESVVLVAGTLAVLQLNRAV